MLSWEYPPHVVGGLGTHVAALVPALARQGVTVHLVTPRWGGGEAEEVVEEHAPASPGTSLVTRHLSLDTRPSSLARIARVDPPVAMMGNFYADVQQTNLNIEEVSEEHWQKGGGFDLIHAHDWLVAFAACSLKRLHKTPLVATIHATERGRGRGTLGGEMSQAINGTEWWLAYEAWRVITASQFMADEVKNYFQVPFDKVDVVPNGVDTAPFDALEDLDLGDFRAKWAAPDEHIVFFVGRVQHEKGAHLIVEAAPRVLAEIPNVQFVIAGTGAMMGAIRERARDLGVADHVNVAGFISDEDRNKLLRVADAAIFPSLYEPFGIVALEAMAAKCPVIVSEVGGLKEVVQHGETGVTIYPDNVESLAWGVLHTLQRPDWAQARATNAYRMVREEYNWDRIAEKTAAVYTRILAEREKIAW
jgi:glycosyltransferase involved in cell wall biosynthesis